MLHEVLLQGPQRESYEGRHTAALLNLVPFHAVLCQRQESIRDLTQLCMAYDSPAECSSLPLTLQKAQFHPNQWRLIRGKVVMPLHVSVSDMHITVQYNTSLYIQW